MPKPKLPTIGTILGVTYPWVVEVWKALATTTSPRDGAKVRPDIRNYTTRILHDAEMEAPRTPIVWAQPYGKVRLIFRQADDAGVIPDCNRHRYAILDVIDVGLVTITVSDPNVTGFGEETFRGPQVARALASVLRWLYPGGDDVE